MSGQLRNVKGTKDLLPADYHMHQKVIELSKKLATSYNYHEMAVPLLEYPEVFSRTLGETSDVVSKEMYQVIARGGETLTLRPEFTAGIARSFITNNLFDHLPLKFFSYGPVFRNERPQNLRQRQFHQINFEHLGANRVEHDAEMIMLGWEVLKKLGISDSITLQINSLGDAPSRVVYRDALVLYLSKYKGDLSEDSQKRLELNPLRILDSKDENDQKIVVGAPKIGDYFNEESSSYFAKLLNYLSEFGIKYSINEHLVRGLDYYTHTIFEFVSSALGAQSTVLAGGRYDGLIKHMGGPDTNAIGFAAGIERLVALVELKSQIEYPHRPIAVLPIGENMNLPSIRLANQLREAGVRTEVIFEKNLGKQMKRANKLNALAGVFVGEDELASDSYKLRWLDSGEESNLPLSDLIKLF